MPIFSLLWLLVSALGLVLALASARVLDGRSRWTRLGWLATAAYFVAVGVAIARGHHVAGHIDWLLVALLTIAFVIAGRRDEPQAEPWFAPRHVGLTGAERRAAASGRGDDARP